MAGQGLRDQGKPVVPPGFLCGALPAPGAQEATGALLWCRQGCLCRQQLGAAGFCRREPSRGHPSSQPRGWRGALAANCSPWGVCLPNTASAFKCHSFKKLCLSGLLIVYEHVMFSPLDRVPHPPAAVEWG